MSEAGPAKEVPEKDVEDEEEEDGSGSDSGSDSGSSGSDSGSDGDDSGDDAAAAGPPADKGKGKAPAVEKKTKDFDPEKAKKKKKRKHAEGNDSGEDSDLAPKEPDPIVSLEDEGIDSSNIIQGRRLRTRRGAPAASAQKSRVESLIDSDSD
mmetsp:Transcript_52439/g.122726  ORF Transcript_52439/g.122726 Transcript_52439/m.122726 type:complete len:152 (+) Transcript_52439:38-493(+)